MIGSDTMGMGIPPSWYSRKGETDTNAGLGFTLNEKPSPPARHRDPMLAARAER